MRNPPPEDQLWQSLVQRVYRSPAGLAGLSAAELCYWDANVLSDEVHNGGFDQFFYNSSGDRFAETVRALRRVGAARCLKLLEQAAMAAFGDLDVPSERGRRWQRCESSAAATQRLAALDREFCEDPDSLGTLLRAFAIDHQLLPPSGDV